MDNFCKTPEQICEELKHVSPLALPGYLMNCELHEQQQVEEIIDEAVRDLEKQGGVTQSLIDVMLPTSVQAVGMVSLKYLNKNLYDKALKGKINFGGILKQVIDFQYDSNFIALSKGGDEILHYNMKHDASGISDKYNRKEWDNEARKRQFKEQYQGDTDVTGHKIYKSEAEAKAAGGDYNRDALTADHVVPIKQIHEQYGSFAQRYVGQEKMNQIANSDKNYQGLNASTNSSKQDKSAEKFCDDTAERLERKPDDTQRERKEKIVASRGALRENEKNAEHHLQKELLKAGAGTVAMEQIGRVIETLIGPMAFEIKDSIRNGICYGLDTGNVFDALWKRIQRMCAYVLRQLPRLIGDLLGDLSQMLIQLASAIFDIFAGIFKKFINLVMSGISIIIEAVKVCMSPGMSAAEKGDAISKLLVTLAVNIVGNFALEALFSAINLPPFLTDILTPLISAAASAIILYLFDRLDLFSRKREIRQQRIMDLFDTRRDKIREITSQFDILASERLKQDRIRFETLKSGMNEMLANKDFEGLSDRLTHWAEFLKVTIPYKNTAEFVEMLRKNSVIEVIAS